MIAAGWIFWLCVFMIGYVYAGYPLILAFLARLRRSPEKYQPVTPKVTMMIAAYNEEAVIASKLENALGLEYPSDHLQILVAADGSDDRTPDIVRKFGDRGVELSYDPQRNGKMAAINRAMQFVRYEIVLFSDANNLYEADTLRELVKPFSNPQVGAVSGKKYILDGNDALSNTDGIYWRYESFIKENETRLGSCTGVSGEILAVRRALYQPPPGNVINDDFFIGLNVMRQGYRLVYAPKARSVEQSSLTEKDEATRRIRIVAGRYQAMIKSGSLLPWNQPILVWQIVSHKFMRPLVPLMMILAIVANTVALIWPAQSSSNTWLSLGKPYNWIFFALQILFYLLAWFGGHVHAKGLIGKILYLPTFLLNSNISAVVGLYSFINGRQTSLWTRARRRDETAQ
jgi:cellulose synthase/poly-beta-1,6-N-acetylglucosamine synthase-like glycosyltransferase